MPQTKFRIIDATLIRLKPGDTLFVYAPLNWNTQQLQDFNMYLSQIPELMPYAVVVLPATQPVATLPKPV
jgi:hypothetical protein